LAIGTPLSFEPNTKKPNLVTYFFGKKDEKITKPHNAFQVLGALSDLTIFYAKYGIPTPVSIKLFRLWVTKFSQAG
jgi:hypothetical protein